MLHEAASVELGYIKYWIRCSNRLMAHLVSQQLFQQLFQIACPAYGQQLIDQENVVEGRQNGIREEYI